MANKDKKDDAASSEYTSATSDSDYIEDQPAALFGNLRTRLQWQPSSKTMHLDVRQSLQNRRNLEFRYKAKLDTNKGTYTHMAQLQKNMNQNTPSMARIIAVERGIELEENDKPLNPDKFLPAGLSSLVLKDWTLSPGVRLRTSSSSSNGSSTAEEAQPARSSSSSSFGDSVKYFVTLRKQPQVLRRTGIWDSWLTGKCDIELDPKQQNVAVRSSLRVKAFRFNITDKQDLQAALGLDYSMATGSSSGKHSLTPYYKVGDNSWSLRLQRGLLQFNYEI